MGKLLALLLVALSGAMASFASYADDIRIGFIFSKTGPCSADGVPQSQAATLAVRDYQAKNPQPKIEEITLDDASDPSTAARNARKLISEDRVDVLVGTSCGLSSSAVAGVAEEGKKPFVSTYASHGPATGKDEQYTFGLGISRNRAIEMARSLSVKSSKRVEVNSQCLASLSTPTFMPPNTTPPDAYVCPGVSIASTRLDAFNRSYSKAFKPSFSNSDAITPPLTAVISYVATDIALQGVGQAKKSAIKDVASKIREGKFETMVGIMEPAKANPLRLFLVAVAATPDTPKTVTEQVLGATSKKCDCKKGSACPTGHYTDIVVVAKSEDCCKKGSACPSGSFVVLE